MARPGPKRSAGDSQAHRPASAATRQALVGAAVQALKDAGFQGASARGIAGRAGCNQALVFYHFGSVAHLLLAALDEVSRRRMARYEASVTTVDTPGALVDAAQAIFCEDLDEGHMAVLAEMIAGASSTPGLGAEVARRLAPWRAFAASTIERALATSPLGQLVPAPEIAHAVVALYLGLELLAHLDGDRAPALALFDRGRRIADVLEHTLTPAHTKEEP